MIVNWRRAVLVAGVVALGGFTIFLTDRFITDPSAEAEAGAVSQARHAAGGRDERGAGELLRRGMIKVEDQSGRPGVKSRDFSETVEGIDIDKNGIRDDVQDYIVETYRNLSQRNAMLQYARAVEGYMFRAANIDELRGYWPPYAKSMACLMEIFGDEWEKNAGEIKAQLLNTRPRIEAYIRTKGISKNNIWELYVGDAPCSE